MKIIIEYDDGVPFASYRMGKDDARAWRALFEDSSSKSTEFEGTEADTRAREFARDLINAARAAQRKLESDKLSVHETEELEERHYQSPTMSPEPANAGSWNRLVANKLKLGGGDRDGQAFSLPSLLAGKLFKKIQFAVQHPVKLASGQYGLAPTFWKFGAGVASIVYIAAALLFSIGDDSVGLALWIVGFHMIYSIFVWIGVWRSATRHQGKPVWRALAKVTVIAIPIAVFSLIVSTAIVILDLLQ